LVWRSRRYNLFDHDLRLFLLDFCDDFLGHLDLGDDLFLHHHRLGYISGAATGHGRSQGD
jgi:hypothetical protein